MKLNALKVNLKRWNETEFGNVTIKKMKRWNDLNALDSIEDSSSLSEDEKLEKERLVWKSKRPLYWRRVVGDKWQG